MRKIFYILFLLALIASSNSYAQSRLGMESISTNSRYLKFFPNPAIANINFDLQKSYNNHFSLTIFNLMGKKVAEIRNINSHTNINLDAYYRGIYIFQLRDKNGIIIESGKFQVLR